MDRISRAGLNGAFFFLLALVSGYAGAVAIPQGPDNVNLHASDGIDLTSRAAKWEFQQAADGLAARGAFNVGGKGMGFAGNMVRNITRQQLLKGALGASRLLGGWGGAAAILAPIVFDALNQAWKLPDVAGPGEIQSLLPAGSKYSPPYNDMPLWCDDFGGGWQGPLSADTWRFEVMGANPGSPWVYSRICAWHDSNKPRNNIYGYNVTSGTQAANCLSKVRAVLVISGGVCGSNGSGRPPTDDEFQNAMNDGLNRNPSAIAPMAAYLHDNGASIEAGDPYTEGPAHTDGPTTTDTSTSDAGTATTKTQRAWDMNYQGRDVTLKETETVTKTDEQGNTTTETKTHTQTGGDTPPPSSAKGDASDICVDHPDASACSPLGDAGDDPELEHQDYPVTFGYTSVTASCPAPKVVTFLGQEISWSFEGPCTFAQGVRPIVIAVALLAALFFVVKVGRG